jgi:hypothetical protein
VFTRSPAFGGLSEGATTQQPSPCQIAREPIATGARVVDQDEVGGVGLQRAANSIHSGVPGTDGAEGDDLCIVVFGHRGDRAGRLMDIETDVKRARLWHG